MDSIDEAIERTEALIAAAEDLRESLRNELLTRGIPGWHSEYKEVPRFGTIPADWGTAPLEDMAEILDSRRVPLNADQRAKIKGIYPYYGANGVVDYIDRWIFDEEQDLILLAEDGGHFGDFRTRPIAYRVKGKCWINNHAHVLTARSPKGVSFLYHALARKNIHPFINGTTRSKLTQGDLRNIRMAVPRVEEQARIGHALDAADNTVEQIKRERDVRAELKKSVADALLTGKVRVVDGVAA